MGILCHILGLNDYLKYELTKYFKSSNTVIKDIDKINYKLTQNRKIILLRNKKGKRREYRRYINNEFNRLLINVLNKHKKKDIILIGDIHLDINVNINTPHKFFININPDKYTKELIRYNIFRNIKKIINGKYSIRQIDFNILKNNYVRNIRKYSKKKYIPKTYLNLLRWIENKTPEKKEIIEKTTENNNVETTEDNSLIYIGSIKNYTNYIYKSRYAKKRLAEIDKIMGKTMITKEYKMIGYKSKWLAVLSSFPDSKKKFRKGFYQYKRKVIPFLEELYENAFVELETPCYLYAVKSDNFKKYKGYKYINNEKIDINNKTYIGNIKDWLKTHNIKLVKFKHTNE